MITSDQLIGGWQGLSDDGVFYIMNLCTNRPSTLAYTSLSSTPIVIKATGWRCGQKRFLLTVGRSADNPDDVQKIEGICGWLTMDLTVSGEDWQRKVVFYREEEWERLRSLLKEKVNQGEVGEARGEQHPVGNR